MIMTKEERREYHRQKQREYRERKKENGLLFPRTKNEQKKIEKKNLTKTISVYLQMKEKIQDNLRNRQRKEWQKIKN